MKNNNYVKKIIANRGVLVYIVALVALFMTFIIVLDFSFDAYQHAEATDRKIVMMRKATETYEVKKIQLEKEHSKPVTEAQIDEVQTNMLMKIKRHKLALMQINHIGNTQEKEKDRIFEMEINGPYDNTMTFIDSIKDMKALLSVLSVSFAPEKDKLKTFVKYKIYVR